MPHVSVIIPVYNSAPLVGAALRSVFAQTFTDFEVIVVDDGSDDREALGSVLDEWGNRVRLVRQPNGGPASARNTGILHAAGELIAFLDADDEWMPEKLARQVQYFERHPETGLLHTGLIGEAHNGTATGGPPRAAFCDLFHTSFSVNTLTVMVPRRVLVEADGFDERREVHIEDWDLWLRIAARHPVGYLPEALGFHRPGGLMSRQVERTYQAQELVIEKNRALCASACARHRAAPRQCEHARRHVLHRDWGYDRLQAGDRVGARAQLRQAVSHRPWNAPTRLLYLSTFLPDAVRRRGRRLLGDRWLR
jgi:glycosyltransferase involved in cell wall biosynthesis